MSMTSAEDFEANHCTVDKDVDAAQNLASAASKGSLALRLGG